MLRVLYTAGPGNAFSTFDDWRNGRSDQATSHSAYSRQFYEACARHEAAALITCYYPGGQEQTYGNLTVVQRPDPTAGKSGMAFHQSLAQKARQNIADAIAFDANVVLIAEDTSPHHYRALAKRGVRVIQALHTRLWGGQLSLMQRLRRLGHARGYTEGFVSVLSASNEITNEIRFVDKNRKTKIIEFLPHYKESFFSGLSVPKFDAEIIDICFIGRVEVSKGVLDLVEIASGLSASGFKFRFHICGVGSALDSMRNLVEEKGHSERFVFHGWCNREALRNNLDRCQITIVPTRASVPEGFNQVIVESILAGRPVVASDACPAVNYVGDAIAIVRGDDISGYIAAIRALGSDRGKLREMYAACPDAGRPFLSEGFSFGAALDEVFAAAKDGRPMIEKRMPTSIASK